MKNQIKISGNDEGRKHETDREIRQEWWDEERRKEIVSKKTTEKKGETGRTNWGKKHEQ